MSNLAWEKLRIRLSLQFRELRQARSWTRRELAKRASVQMRDVWRVENGYLKHITTQTLHRLANAFGMAVDIRFCSLLGACA